MLIGVHNSNTISYRGHDNVQNSSLGNLYKDAEELFANYKEKQTKRATKIQKRDSFMKKYKIPIVASLMVLSCAIGYLIAPFAWAIENKRFKDLNKEINSKKNELDSLDKTLVLKQKDFDKKISTGEALSDSLVIAFSEQVVAKQQKIDSLNEVLSKKKVEADKISSSIPPNLDNEKNRTFSLYPNGNLKEEILWRHYTNGEMYVAYKVEYSPDGQKIREYTNLEFYTNREEPRVTTEYFKNGDIKHKTIEKAYSSGNRYIAYEVKYRKPGIKESELFPYIVFYDSVVSEIYKYDNKGNLISKEMR